MYPLSGEDKVSLCLPAHNAQLSLTQLEQQALLPGSGQSAYGSDCRPTTVCGYSLLSHPVTRHQFRWNSSNVPVHRQIKGLAAVPHNPRPPPLKFLRVWGRICNLRLGCQADMVRPRRLSHKRCSVSSTVWLSIEPSRWL